MPVGDLPEASDYQLQISSNESKTGQIASILL
jgi:hypothetical protein